MKRYLSLMLLCCFLGGMLTSCLSDPRKNCNHPKHWEYVKEHQQKRLRRHGL